MPLKAVVEKLDDVEEPYRNLYTERNGKFEITGIEGLRTQADVDRLQTALTKERSDHKAVKDRYSVFANMDIADIQAKLDRFPELEAAAAGNLDDNKINGIVQTRIKSILSPVERERDTLKTQLADSLKTISEYQEKETRRRISDKVREAAAGAKIIPEALEDALLLAERVFEVTEDGRVVTRDNVGVTPGIEPSVWFTDLQNKRPHWWGPSTGGGAGGSNRPGGTQINPWTHANWNMTEQGKLFKADPIRAEQLAKAAGTTIGGQKPPPAK